MSIDSRDRSGLGRGPFTRWLPVLLQAEASPPTAEPYRATADTTTGRFLLQVLFSASRLTIPATILAVLWQIGEALVPVIAGAAIDRALATGDVAQLVLWLAILAANFLMLSLSYRFASQLSARGSELVQHRLRATLSSSVLHPATASPRGPGGDVVSTMTNDVARIGQLRLVVFPVGEAAGVIFIAVSLLLIHPLLGLVTLVGAPLAVWLMSILSRHYARTSRSYQTLLAETVGQATDLVTGYRVIKGVRAEGEATNRYQQASQRTLKGAFLSTTALGRFRAGSDTVAGVFVAGVAALAGWFAVTGELSIGGLIAGVGLAQSLLAPMQMITGNAIPFGAAAYASAGRVLEHLTEGMAPNTESPSTGASLTAVPALDLLFPDRDAIRIKPGECVAIRTHDHEAALLTDALLHPHRAATACIRLDNISAQDLTEREYRERVVVAPHHAALFTGTLTENLALTGAATETQTLALWATASDDVIASVGGLEGEIGEMGGRLSGGQRQRLALARALASEAPILVLQDPTTAVDSVTEALIAERFSQLRRGRTTLIFTASPALLGACDRIIDLRAGGLA
ncbi:ABC transporter transmembrane domain-containing protein [Gulosibacter chungangensis]|uniref:ABC transporter ATP-binding protein n=1 Tax=Gulosibacter chungangensis TaxID=979746 RepID=A0A7J5BB17_9MICO|nr:ABC transporter ATP-binding protein [Gulosibacter chungangensis]KAB1643235.1 ABC transporter ATP-binding protein [Gulosibacter chungangensis]